MHRAIMERVRRAIEEHLGSGRITCRLTHAYTDGPAPYYTALARGPPANWAKVKRVASDTILEFGGTATHHHAVGKMHADHYRRETSAMNVPVLTAMKTACDPRGILNPGVLLEPGFHSSAKL